MHDRTRLDFMCFAMPLQLVAFIRCGSLRFPSNCGGAIRLTVRSDRKSER